MRITGSSVSVPEDAAAGVQHRMAYRLIMRFMFAFFMLVIKNLFPACIRVGKERLVEEELVIGCSV